MLHYRWISLFAVLIAVIITSVATGNTDLNLKKYSFEESVCRVLENRFVSSNPWISYPIVYNPINHGKLIVWTATSSLPTCEFKCSGLQEPLSAKESNNTTLDHVILLDFGNSAIKLEWTFYDVVKGITYNGVSVNHIENSKFLLSIEDLQSSSYLNCNLIKSITSSMGAGDTGPGEDVESEDFDLRTTCQDCDYSLIKLINSQLRELIKSNLKIQLNDNLYWHLSQLLINQQFQTPIEIVSNEE